MADYKHMYTALFNAVTDALAELADGNLADAEYRLKKGQLAAEEVYAQTAPDVHVLRVVRPADVPGKE